MVNIKAFVCNPFQENSYFAWDEEGSCVAIDPSFYDDEEKAAVLDMLRKENLTLKAIWLTHAHFDHIYGVAALQSEYSVPVLMGAADEEILVRTASSAEGVCMRAPDIRFSYTPLHDGDVLDVLKGSPFKAIATPGHTQGGFCFYDEVDRVLFSGDTLFKGTIGRTDLYGGDYDKLIVSVMDGLMGFPGDVDVLPGHGDYTTIAEERTNNPFLQPFNEPEGDGLDWDGESIDLHPTDNQ